MKENKSTQSLGNKPSITINLQNNGIIEGGINILLPLENQPDKSAPKIKKDGILRQILKAVKGFFPWLIKTIWMLIPFNSS